MIPKKRKEKERSIPIIRYLIYMLLVTGVVTGVTFSRYTSTYSGYDTAHVAKFEVTPKMKNDLGSLTLDPSIYATSKLSDAENCEFDDVAVVRKIYLENKSEVAIQAEIASITSMDSQGIVWCIFNESDAPTAADHIYDKIRDKVSAKVGSVPTDFTDLQSALSAVNTDAIAAWNTPNSTVAPVSDSKVLTVVFWAEHDGVITADPTMLTTPKVLKREVEYQFRVTQVD